MPVRNRLQNVTAVLEKNHPTLPTVKKISAWAKFAKQTEETVAESLPW